MPLEDAVGKHYAAEQETAEARGDDGRTEEQRAYSDSSGRHLRDLQASRRHGLGGGDDDA